MFLDYSSKIFKEIASSLSHGKKHLLLVLISRDTFLSLAPLSFERFSNSMRLHSRLARAACIRRTNDNDDDTFSFRNHR